MRLLIQRVSRASVSVAGGQPRAIGPGLVVFVGIGPADDEGVARKVAEKTSNLRIFSNDDGKFDKSVLDVKGEALVVSQFTLYGDCGKGRRPDFSGSMPPLKAEPLYRYFFEELKELGVPVKTGDFGAKMMVEISNDGPVTIWIES